MEGRVVKKPKIQFTLKAVMIAVAVVAIVYPAFVDLLSRAAENLDNFDLKAFLWAPLEVM